MNASTGVEQGNAQLLSSGSSVDDFPSAVPMQRGNGRQLSEAFERDGVRASGSTVDDLPSAVPMERGNGRFMPETLKQERARPVETTLGVAEAASDVSSSGDSAKQEGVSQTPLGARRSGEVGGSGVTPGVMTSGSGIPHNLHDSVDMQSSVPQLWRPTEIPFGDNVSHLADRVVDYNTWFTTWMSGQAFVWAVVERHGVYYQCPYPML